MEIEPTRIYRAAGCPANSSPPGWHRRGRDRTASGWRSSSALSSAPNKPAAGSKTACCEPIAAANKRREEIRAITTTFSFSARAIPRAPSWPKQSEPQRAAEFCGVQRGQPSHRDSSAGGTAANRNGATSPRRDFAARSGTSSATPGAPKLDFVFTVCDNAAKEAVPFGRGSR